MFEDVDGRLVQEICGKGVDGAVREFIAYPSSEALAAILRHMAVALLNHDVNVLTTLRKALRGVERGECDEASLMVAEAMLDTLRITLAQYLAAKVPEQEDDLGWHIHLQDKQ